MSNRNYAGAKISRRRALEALGTGITASVGGCMETVQTDDPELTFHHPDSVPIDESFTLEIEGLPTGTVEIAATAEDRRSVSWSASVTYEVTDGTIDLDADAPTAGDYDVADTMRLIQRMEPANGGSSIYVSPSEEQLSVEVIADGDVVGSTTITRPFSSPYVSSSVVDDGRLAGRVFKPTGTDPTPAVVVLHGSGGEPWLGMAQLLAANGFVALALQYFGTEGVPEELVEVPAEIVDEAATWLLERDRVTGSRVGLIGSSRGGELALLAGSQFDSIGAVVGISASGVAWQGYSETDSAPRSTWTLDGEPVSYVPQVDDPSVWDQQRPYEHEPGFAASLEAASEDRIDEATIPVEKTDAPVLLVSGGDDRLWNAAELSSLAIDRLEARDFEHEYDHLIFEDAGHAIHYPYVPTANRAESEQYVMGGTPAGYAEADAEYWPRALETLRQS
ncbi:acyl-CoA thioester hydrolase/BAAT C-terminal domain-containing protein [Natrinema salsiterrestre]|uniref:Alpha/beta fold hydrolase n=1 Tax=Natrinema salsiterrestre TaxID=2950540 RepID=A0A9Q4L0E1_9EURY|nr:acyl-CoA thioester hydrolase/BAAT C-terminal domain-containing protein [Natrinema salsiterrestre]MDF9745267.1 alpha/beta fold hydrolase [Natrinema salsiterrestre]